MQLQPSGGDLEILWINLGDKRPHRDFNLSTRMDHCSDSRLIGRSARNYRSDLAACHLRSRRGIYSGTSKDMVTLSSLNSMRKMVQGMVVGKSGFPLLLQKLSGIVTHQANTKLRARTDDVHGTSMSGLTTSKSRGSSRSRVRSENLFRMMQRWDYALRHCTSV